MTPSTPLEIIPLGGLGEFGMNFMVYRYGGECLVVDAGMMFPGAEHLGVNVVIPDMSFLESCGKLQAVILTHGHEDHIGALPYLLARHRLPVYGTPFTLGLVRSRLEEHDPGRRVALNPLPPDGEPLELGPFTLECVSAAHSIPQAKMLVLRTPVGVVVHTADFKLDPNAPDGARTDLNRLAELGSQGVLALLSDSTNADRPGFTPSDRSAVDGIETLLAASRSRVLITTFSSNVERIRQLGLLAQRHRRKLALVGTSIQNHVAVAEQLGLIDFARQVRVPVQSAMDLPPERVLLVATGTQGEPMSALARIAVDKHREIRLSPGDLVLHSARMIPGNEKSIGRMINHLLRRGAQVITAADAPIHVSGHPAQDELRLLLRLLRPRFVIPIHGEYRQLLAHARLALECGFEADSVQLAESGDVIVVDPERIRLNGRVQVGQVFIDDILDEVDWTILRDRRRVADDGIVVAVVAVDREGASGSNYVEIVSRGFVPVTEGDDRLAQEARSLVLRTLADVTSEERTDEAILKARIQADLKRFLRRRTQRRPLIIPVIVEL